MPALHQAASANERWQPGVKTWACALAVILLVPFIYETSLALLYASYVHGNNFPSHSFLTEFAGPSNRIAAVPGIGPACNSYFEFCVRILGANDEGLSKR